jgi:peroxiredoxin Q/BCP
MEYSWNMLVKQSLALPVFFMLALWPFGQLRAAELKEGDAAPDFTLKNQDGADVTLSTVWKKAFVVLYFYPMDDTPGCKKQACFFRDLNQEFKQAGAEILGVSVDDVGSHKKFQEKYNLPFTLLADPDKKVVELYGVKSTMMFGKAKRVTFVIGRDGMIKKIYPDVDVSLHSQEVLGFIKSLQAK